MLYILISIAAGVTIVISRIINYNLANKIGIFQGTFFNYVVGLLFSIIFLIFSQENFNLFNLTLPTIPFWAYLGGLTGVAVVVFSNFIIPKTSSFYLTLIIFTGQLLVGIIIDYFTLKQLPLGKILGGLLVVFGLTYNLLIDKKNVSQIASDKISLEQQD